MRVRNRKINPLTIDDHAYDIHIIREIQIADDSNMSLQNRVFLLNEEQGKEVIKIDTFVIKKKGEIKAKVIGNIYGVPIIVIREK